MIFFTYVATFYPIYARWGPKEAFFMSKKGLKNEKLWTHLKQYEMSKRQLFEKIKDLYIPNYLCYVLQNIFCKKL